MELSQIRGSLRGVEIRLGIDLATLGYGDLVGLVTRSERESDQVDFKRQLNPAKPDDLARDIASMANHLGGLIFIGIDEADENGVRGDIPAARRLNSVASKVGAEHVVDWVTKNIADRVVPRVEVGTAWIDDPSQTDSGFLVVGVARSDRAPHGVDLRDGKFHFQRRRGTSNGPLTEAELAASYRARETARSERDALLDRRWQDFRVPLRADRTPTVFARAAIVPEVRGEWLIHEHVFAETQQWLNNLRFPDSRLFAETVKVGSGFAARARRRSVEVTASELVAQFFVDGSTVTEVEVPPQILQFRADGESLHQVREQELLGALTRSIRFGALHALERAATFGRALVKLAVWTNDVVDVRCLRLENAEVKSVRVGTSPLPTGAKSIEGELELGDVLVSERAASHAAWFLMNDLYQSELGAPISTIMGYDGRYRLGELDDPACGSVQSPRATHTTTSWT